MKNIRFFSGVLMLVALCLCSPAAIAFPEDNSPPERQVRISQQEDNNSMAVPNTAESLEVQQLQAECLFVLSDRSCESPVVFENDASPLLFDLRIQFRQNDFRYYSYSRVPGNDCAQNYTSLVLPEPRYAACSAGVDLDRSCLYYYYSVSKVPFIDTAMRLLFYEDDHPAQDFDVIFAA